MFDNGDGALLTCLLPSSLPDNEGEEHGVADVSDGALLQHVPHLRDEGPDHNMSQYFVSPFPSPESILILRRIVLHTYSFTT